MRIRHLVCTHNFAGVERYVATTAAELARRGHDVEVIGGDPEAMRVVLAPAGAHHLAMSRSVDVAKANLGRPEPDVVHSHMTAADLVAVATKPFVRASVVSTVHFAQPRGHDGLTRRAYSVLPRAIDTEIAISQFVADTAGGNSQVIMNGVPAPAALAAPGATGVDGRANVVLVAQRLESEKHTDVALRAFAASGLMADGWELHVAGEGAQRSDLERLADRLGIAASCTFLGRVGDLEARMQGASMLLAAASAEPFGLSVVEAMAAGLPVVAADGGAHRETIGSATPESLFAVDDADAAGTLLRRLADDPDHAAELGRRARDRWAEAFTIETHVDQLEALYQRLVRG